MSKKALSINIFLLWLFIINPIICLLISSFFYFYKKTDTSLLLALSLSLILMYFPMMYDSVANFFSIFYRYENAYLSLYTYIPILAEKFFKLDYIYIFYIYMFVILYCILRVIFESFFKSIDYNFSCKNSKWIALLIFMFLFSYRDLMDLNRTILSYSIFYYYYLIIFNVKAKKRGRGISRIKVIDIFLLISFIVLSLSIHFSSFILWIIFFITINRKRNMDCMYYVAGFVLSVILGIFLPDLLNLFPVNINTDNFIFNKLFIYLTDEQWGNRHLTFGLQIKKSLDVILIISILVGVVVNLSPRWRCNGCNESILFDFSIILFCLTMIFSQYFTLSERLNLAVTFLCVPFICFFRRNSQNYTLNKINMMLNSLIIFLIVLRCCILFIFIYAPFIFYENEVFPLIQSRLDMLIKPFYQSSILLLDFSNNGYSNEYLYEKAVWGK